MLPPSILVKNKRHYIHELAELDSGEWVLPQFWVIVSKVVHAVCFRVSKHVVNNTVRVSVTQDWTRIPTSQLQRTHPELAGQYCIQFDESQHSQECLSRIPNINQKIDRGEDLFLSWWSTWSNDVSGARSKQYQKHMNIYAHHINLPGRLLQQQFYVHPISTSPHAGSLEQFKPIVDHVRRSHTRPIQTFNAFTKRPCGLRLAIPDLPADNPQQSDEASHIGHQGLQKCRNCKPRTHGVFKALENVDGYYNCFYKPGTPRNVQEIRLCVLEQLQLASLGIKDRVEGLQTESGVKDKISLHWISILLNQARKRQEAESNCSAQDISTELLAWLQTETSQPYNPLLDVPWLDPSQDTLVEILHTILLGVEKYGWHNLHSHWNDRQRGLFTICLQSTDISGLKIPPIRAEYMMHFRVSSTRLGLRSSIRLVRALGELAPMLWISEINDMDVYLDDLTTLIDNVLDAFADIDPAKILIKIKLHILVHLPAQIRRRGPAVRFSTEVDEVFNAVFRLCSVFSNHQAASQDIARKLADLDCVKHIVTGGYWQLADGTWVTVGRNVKSLLLDTPVLQLHLGWNLPLSWTPGLVHAEPYMNDGNGRRAKTRPSQQFSQSPMQSAINVLGLQIPDSSCWVKGKMITAFTDDVCSVGAWVVCRYRVETESTVANHEASVLGRVEEIYLPEEFGTTGQGVLILREFMVMEHLHFEFNMPVLKPSNPPRLVLLPSKSIQFQINVQHDCKAAGCLEDGVEYRVQERQWSQVSRKTVVHRNPLSSLYLINTHALHNARLLRMFLPRDLVRPTHLYQNRTARHSELGAELVVSQGKKRIETNRKAAATREQKKAEKAAAQLDALTALEPSVLRR
ncbi:hypothetical protein V5O48_016984 [Marasmius crinis-equi]|uniref:Uncharacterized protein n=1 Tax=Marasmius crinis-equi TaxID=585013 RepID=A0ABR3EQ82_9AGAR